MVLTPNRRFSSETFKRLVAHPRVIHRTWREVGHDSFRGERIIHAWPDRKQLNGIWAVEADALVVIEWSETETADWLAHAQPIQLRAEGMWIPPNRGESASLEPLPNGVDGILEYAAQMAAGYSSGLKWNEEDKLKADMMNRPERWTSVTVEQVRTKCRQLALSPNDIDTIADLVQRRKDGRRFNVRGPYRTFQFK